MMKIKIPNDGRVAFVGKTGSGKTVLAKNFLQQKNRVIVIDPKHTFNLEGFKKSWRLPFSKKEFKLIVRPEMGDDERLAYSIMKFKREGNLTIYVDELSTLAEQFKFSTEILADLARTGRELNVSLWNAVQRPRRVPLIFFTETELFFIFRLRNLDDRGLMAEYAGEDILEEIPKYSFWYSKDEDDSKPPRLKLDLKTGIINLDMSPILTEKEVNPNA